MAKPSIPKRLIDTVNRGDRFRLFRYFIAGTAISLGYTFTIVALVDWFPLARAEIANVISLVFWTIISYVIHREFTFRFDGEYGGSVVRFIFVFTAKLIASIGCMTITTRYYQSSYLIGVIVNWVVLPLSSYLALKLWVFQSALKMSLRPRVKRRFLRSLRSALNAPSAPLGVGRRFRRLPLTSLSSPKCAPYVRSKALAAAVPRPAQESSSFLTSCLVGDRSPKSELFIVSAPPSLG